MLIRVNRSLRDRVSGINLPTNEKRFAVVTAGGVVRVAIG
jgi:hypothetical protein